MENSAGNATGFQRAQRMRKLRKIVEMDAKLPTQIHKLRMSLSDLTVTKNSLILDKKMEFFSNALLWT